MGLVHECDKCGGKQYHKTYRNGTVTGGPPPESQDLCTCNDLNAEIMEFLKNN